MNVGGYLCVAPNIWANMIYYENGDVLAPDSRSSVILLLGSDDVLTVIIFKRIQAESL
jgi:hypothetical protein